MPAIENNPDNSFDTAYNKLVSLAHTDDFSVIQSLAISCMHYMDRKNGDILCDQMQKLHYAMWLNPAHCGPILLGNMFSPYMGMNPDQPIPAALLASPSIVRSLLLIANRLDDPSNPSARSSQPMLVKLLLSIPGVSATSPQNGELMNHVGAGVLGTQWEVLRALFTLPENENWEMREALHNLPDQAFMSKKEANESNTILELPVSMWDERP